MVYMRAFNKQDFPAVKSIYQQGIETGHATFQERAKDWDEWNASLLVSCRLVAQLDEKVVGWATLSPVSTRSVYSGVAEVSIYVDLNIQGRGVGHALLSKLVSCSEEQGIWTLQASIFPENNASVSLHKKNGFKTVGLREKLGQMKGIWRDVVLMERRSDVVGLAQKRPHLLNE